MAWPRRSPHIRGAGYSLSDNRRDDAPGTGQDTATISKAESYRWATRLMPRPTPPQGMTQGLYLGPA